MIEHNMGDLRDTAGQNCYDIAEVVKGACATLHGEKLTQDEVIELLLRLLTRSKAITTAMLKESAHRCERNADYHEMRCIFRANSYISLSIKRVLHISLHRYNPVFCWKTCLSGIYIPLGDMGRLLDKTLATEIDLMYWHAGQVLALIANSIYVIQTHALFNGLPENDDKRYVAALLARKTEKILAVVSRSMNMLQPENRMSYVMMCRTTAELHILNRLVVNSALFELRPSENWIISDIIEKRIWAVKTQLLFLLTTSEVDRKNELLCQIIDSMLLYYKRVVLLALYSLFPTQACHEDSSLAFCIIRDLSLALEIRALFSDAVNASPPAETIIPKSILKKVSYICDGIYEAITSYYKQLLLLGTQPLSTVHAYLHTCLKCVEYALQDVRSARSRGSAFGYTINKRLEALEESLTESGKLCAWTMQHETMSSHGSYPSGKLDTDLSVLNCFCSMDRAASWNAINEEMWLQGSESALVGLWR